MMMCYHVIFAGKVQGVGFRYFVCQTAGDCRIRGWVRNLPDLSVELLAEGEKDDLECLMTRVHSHFNSFIRDVHLQPRPASGAFERFLIVD